MGCIDVEALEDALGGKPRRPHSQILTSDQVEAIRWAEAALRCFDSHWSDRAKAAQNLVEAFGLKFELFNETELPFEKIEDMDSEIIHELPSPESEVQ